MTYEQLLSDKMRLDATVRNLMIIGEAARALPEEIRQTIPDVPWRDIVAMRNILTHAYFGIDTGIVWTVSIEKLPLLRQAVAQYLGSIDQ